MKNNDSWKVMFTEITTALLSPIIIVGAFWYIAHDIKEDVDRIERNHERDRMEMREDRRKSDERWEDLLSKFHTVDKDVVKLNTSK